MTDHDQPDPGQAVPEPDQAVPEPAWGSWAGPAKPLPRVDQLAAWIEANRTKFTEAALERSAIDGGYSAEEFIAALALLTRRDHERQAIRPIKHLARITIVVAYALVWLLFAYAYIVAAPHGGSGLSSGWGRVLQLILTGALLVGLAISAIAVNAARPDPDRFGRALVIVLAVPVITLIAITGLCLPALGAA